MALPQDRTLSCDEQRNHGSDRNQFCEIRETTIPAAGHLDIDGGTNGGVSVTGSNRNDILVRSKVEADEDDLEASRRMAGQIHVETSGGRIRAEGPTGQRHGWGVSFEILVPQRTDLVLRTHNGGIGISGVEGHISFEAVNGGVHLEGLAGSVEGHTTNGGLHLELARDHWEGDKCDVSTTNGGVTILVPTRYSAHLETDTVNGGVRVAFPVTVQGEINKQLAVDLGSGGNLVRATTTNGGVTVKRSM